MNKSNTEGYPLMSRNTPLNSLRVFESVARLGSISAAASELFLTPSAVSKHISKLENYFDAALFNHNGPKLFLTSTGIKLSEKVRGPFQEVYLICDEIKSRKSTIKIKTPSSFYIRILADALSSYDTPIENVSMWMDTELIDFTREPYNCAIQYGSGIFPSHWESIKLLEEHLVPVCTPDVLENYHAGQAYNVIHPSPDKTDWSRWFALFPDYIRSNTNKEHIFDTMDLAISAALKGLGIALVDEQMIKKELISKKLIKLCDVSLSTGSSYYFVYPKSVKSSDNISNLLNFIQSNL